MQRLEALQLGDTLQLLHLPKGEAKEKKVKAGTLYKRVGGYTSSYLLMELPYLSKSRTMQLRCSSRPSSSYLRV